MEQSLINVERYIRKCIIEAAELLDDLPENITFYLDNDLIIPGNGTGGTLLEPNLIGIGYDIDFKDKEMLFKNLRATVLHECYHSVQGWSDRNSLINPKTLLEDGVLEGAATVFEKEYGGTNPLWSNYESDEIMYEWLKEILAQKLEPNSQKYSVYKFGEVDGVKWMLYKVGTWLIDKVLENNNTLDIVHLSDKKPEELIQLSGIFI